MSNDKLDLESIFDKMFDPAFQVESEPISRRIAKMRSESRREAEQDGVETQRQEIDLDAVAKKQRDTTKPLTKEESEAADRKIQELLGQMERIRGKMGVAKEKIDNELKNEKTTFVFEVGKRPVLKRALKAIYGAKLPYVTWEMYKECLERKKELQKSEGESFFEEDEDDE